MPTATLTSPRGPDVGAPAAGALMTSPVTTVDAGQSVLAAYALLASRGVHHLVVLDDDDHCLGVLDDRLLAQHWPASPGAAAALPVGSLLVGPTVCVLAGTPASRIARTMLAAQVDAVPVVDPGGRVLGVVTTRDLLTVLAVADTVVLPEGATR